jgi:hypothetical protein
MSGLRASHWEAVMADKRDEREQYRGEQRDPERERRIERRADIYRGSDERGYGGGERLGREWERGDSEGSERFSRSERLHSADEDHFDRGGRGGEERSSRGWDDRGFREAPRELGERRFHDELREERERARRYGDRSYPGSLPHDSGRFGTRGFGEVFDQEGRHQHYNLAGLHDLGDLSELRERYQEHRRPRDYEPRYGHGPGIENMESPRLGYSTSMSRWSNTDHELGHGGFIGDLHRTGAPQPSGRGPKGYQRSDARIREDICDRLMMSWMNAENVDVVVRDGEVTLQGTVKSRDEKRAIEALAEAVLGVKDITNALRLERADQARTEAQPEQRGEQLPQTQNLKDRPQAQNRQGQEQERRAKDQEQTSAPKPGDTPLRS